MPTLFLNPLFRLAMAAVASLMLLGGIWFGIQHAIKKHDDGIRQEVHQEYETKALKQAVKDAEEDRIFAEEQAAKAQKEAAALRAELAATSRRIAQARNQIHGRIASGELSNGPASSTVLATVDEIERMEGERKGKAK